jgi:hypothetical protein
MAYMGKTSAQTALVRIVKESNDFEHVGVDGRIILK